MEAPEFHGEITNILPTFRTTVAVDVMERNIPNSRKFVIRLSQEIADDPMSCSFVDMCPDNASALAELLECAAMVTSGAEEVRAGIIGVRQLPKIRLCDRYFYIDARMRQLRNVENPMHFFDLVDPFEG